MIILPATSIRAASRSVIGRYLGTHFLAAGAVTTRPVRPDGCRSSDQNAALDGQRLAEVGKRGQLDEETSRLRPVRALF